MKTTKTVTRPGVTTNKESRLYVIPCGGGYSCLGFDVMDSKARRLAAWLGVAWQERKGTAKAYRRYVELIGQVRARYESTGERCPTELCKQLIGFEGRRVEVITASGERCRFKVGRSTGWIPCHIALARRDSSGGGAVTGAPFQSVRVIA